MVTWLTDANKQSLFCGVLGVGGRTFLERKVVKRWALVRVVELDLKQLSSFVGRAPIST